MSEIEKLMQNAGIEPTKNWQSCLNCKLKTEKLYDEWGEEYFTCVMFENPEKCSEAKEYYPLFTTEKQLELIKVIAKGQIGGICIEINVKDTVTISARQDYNRYFEFQEWGSDLPEALAKLITTLWQDLTESEKAEIRRVLE